MFEKLKQIFGFETTKWEALIDHTLFIDTGMVKEVTLVDVTTTIDGRKLLEFYLFEKGRYEDYFPKEVELVSDLGETEYGLTEKGLEALKELVGDGGD